LQLLRENFELVTNSTEEFLWLFLVSTD